jgi:hypothetical protein
MRADNDQNVVLAATEVGERGGRTGSHALESSSYSLLRVTNQPIAPFPELAAWREFCGTLVEAGERLLEPGFPAGNPDASEAVRHLATQTVCWLSHAFARERDLGIHRLNDLLTPWGGPNADNVYHYAAIDDQSTYRLHGRMGSCEQILMALRVGNLHQKENGTLGEGSASDFGIGQGDEVDLILSPSGDGGLKIPPGTRMISIREYYYHWRPLEPAMLLLDRIDGPPPSGGVVRALEAAGEQFTSSLTYWAEYMVNARERGVDNTFIQPRKEPRGLQTMSYSFCFWALQPDEALVVTFPVPEAAYWSTQLYQLGWFEALDMVRQTSLNHVQTRTGPDGTVTVVVSGADPGVANWLDTEGRPEGLLTLRCAWLTAAAPKAETRVVKLAELEAELGSQVPRIDASGRAAEIAARREHLAWRFRS